MTNDDGPMGQLSAHIDRAWDLVNRGDFAGAMRSAEKCAELDSETPEVHNLMGFIRAQEGQAEQALEHYERAMELDEGFVEAMLNAAEVKLHPLEDWSGAIALVEQALDWIDDPEEQADAMLIRIEALLGKGDRAAAAAALRALPDGPFENPGIPFSIGRARFETGDAEGAEAMLRQALEKDPRHADAHYHLGLVLQARGALRDASIAFLCARDADLKGPARPPLLPADAFERRVRAAMEKLPAPLAAALTGALVMVVDVPGAEVVAEGVDPRIPALLDDLSPEGEPFRAGRVFIYQANVERAALHAADVEREIRDALVAELEHAFPELAAAPLAPS